MRCPECGAEDSLFLHYNESFSSDTGPFDDEWYRCCHCYKDFDAEEIDTYYSAEDEIDNPFSL